MLNASKLATQKVSRLPETFEAGTYPARLRQIVDIGLQPQRPFQGQEKPPAQELLCTYELVDEFLLGEDGQPDETSPINVSDRFPFYSLDNKKAKSTTRYLALDPQMVHGGDWSKLVDTPVFLTVVVNPGKDGRKYVNVQGVTLPPKKQAANISPLVNPIAVFDLDAPDLTVFDTLPEWIKNLIRSNLRFNGSKLAKMLEVEEKDNTPADFEKLADQMEEEAPW